MRVLVTGAGGFLGRTLVPQLVAEGHEVVAATRAGTGAPTGAHGLALDLARLIDPDLLPAELDCVVHLAQSSRYRDFPDGTADVIAVNVTATAALLDHARRSGARRFILASTGGVYGSGGHLRESQAPAPRDFYQRSKYAAEVLTGAYADLLDTIILRPFFMYGPGQQGMLIGNLAGRVRRGEPITIAGDPGMRFNPIYVDDAARAVVAALEPGVTGPVNVAGTEEVSLTELVLALAELDGREADLHHDPDAGSTDLVACTDRLRKDLGVQPRVSLADGLVGVLSSVD